MTTPMEAPVASWRELLHRLDRLGFFDYAAPGTAAEVDARLGEVTTFYELTVILQEHEMLRSFSADGEDLAEGGVVRYLGDLAPFLATQNIRVTASQEWRDDAKEYFVTVNGRRHAIYTAETLESVGWRAGAAINYLALVEALLREAGSPERVYAVRAEFGGDASRMMILTPAMAALINASAHLPQSADPYLPPGAPLLSVREVLAWLD